MRIDSMGAQSGYPAPQNKPTSGNTDVATEDAVRVDNSVAQNMAINHQEGQASAEERSAQNEHEVIQAIERANKHIRTYDRRLEFSIHDATKQILVKVINTEDDTVIREIPSEKVLDMVAHMWEVAGILVDEKR